VFAGTGNRHASPTYPRDSSIKKQTEAPNQIAAKLKARYGRQVRESVPLLLR